MNQQQQQQQQEQQQNAAMDAFRAGMTACLRSWSALRTAVMHGWGGIDSLQKAEDLRSNLYEQCFCITNNSSKPRMELQDLEDCLAIYMEEEFGVVLEDGSEQQVAQTMWHMFEQAARGDFTTCQQVVAAAQAAAALEAAHPAQIQSVSAPGDGIDDDDDDSTNGNNTMDMDDHINPAAATAAAPRISNMINMTSAGDYAAQYLFGEPPQARRQKLLQQQNAGPVRQLGETAPSSVQQEQPLPQVDDDGFAPIKRKGKKKPV